MSFNETLQYIQYGLYIITLKLQFIKIQFIQYVCTAPVTLWDSASDECWSPCYINLSIHEYDYSVVVVPFIVLILYYVFSIPTKFIFLECTY